MQVLLNLLAAVALLVWGTQIVRTGVLRLWGTSLRQVLRSSAKHRYAAFLAGIGVTGLLQSSTATALLVSSFVGQGVFTTAAALAVMLGADVGTALMVKLFALNLTWLAPLAIIGGVVIYLTRSNDRAGQAGRLVLGLGVMILALQLIVQATAPMAHAAGVKVLFSQLTGDSALDVLVGALLSMMFYSSLAVVLLTATLASSSVISLPVAMAIVLGANLGGGFLAFITTLRADPATRWVPLGNLLFKVVGCGIALPLLPFALARLTEFDATPKDIVVNAHLAINLLIFVVFIQLVGVVAKVVQRWLPAPRPEEQRGAPRHLDETALTTPSLAIGNAAREAIRLADIVEDMLAGLLQVLKTNDSQLATRLAARDDEIDRLYTAIKLYLTQVSREALEAEESRRWTDIVHFTINMEHAGDIIERVLIDVAQRKIAHGLSFSEAGLAEIEDLNQRLIGNLRLAVTVFLHGDLKSAQQLVEEKVSFRDLEMRYADQHLQRLSGNSPQSIETSSLHLDLLSDFKRISSLFCGIAYPILDQAGVLAKTRILGQSAP